MIMISYRSILLVFLLLPSTAWTFVTPTQAAFTFHTNTNTHTRILLLASNIADFEYQEMRAQLEAMERQQLPSRDLPLSTRMELESYVAKIADKRPSPIPLTDIARVLPDTTWRLTFSTQAATLADLPRDATVLLEFKPEHTNNVDYILEFSQVTFGLNRIVAKSSYQVDTRGIVTFVYNDIVTDVFGFKNIGVGFFGLLKGRANYVESIYMDGRFWIERGYTVDGQGTYYNVYMKQGI